MRRPLHEPLVELDHPADVSGWRQSARRLLIEGVPPEAVTWSVRARGERVAGTDGLVSGGAGTADLFGAAPIESEPATLCPVPAPRVPKAFGGLCERVVCHRDPQRFAVLYRVLWRLQQGEPRLLDNAADDDVFALHRWDRAVARDRHKMHAFVRFRATPGVVPEHFSAWFEPDHHILRLTSGFFRRRFASMHFSIYTPEASVHWDTEQLRFGPAATRAVVDRPDAMEALWREYYASIFNPARLKLDAMRAEMPVKYWKNLPEAPLIAALSREAGRRTEHMVEAAATEAPRFARAAGLSGRAGLQGADAPAGGAFQGEVEGAGFSEADRHAALKNRRPRADVSS